MQDQNEIEILIVRFLSGDCSRNEYQELLSWINLNAQNKAEYLALKDIWDASWKIDDQANDHLIHFYKNQHDKRKKASILFLKRAVAFAALLFIGLIIGVLISDQPADQPGNLQVFSVPLGSRSKVLLTDGTEINLNSGSELSYAGNFSSSNRSVSLAGEAFFRVKSDPQHPFIVKTKDFDSQVTGTQFNICSYNEDAFSTTTLAEGSINLKIKNCDQIISVKPGEKFMLDRTVQKYSLSAADVEQEVAWKDGEFIFKNIPFPELLQRLERWYDVRLTYSGSKLTKYSYTGRFKNQETIWQVLDALKLTSPIDYQKTTFREFKISYKSSK